MPRRNTRKGNLAATVYHGYNRQRDGVAMFRDDEDRRYFKQLFARCLSVEPQFDDRGRAYRNYRDGVRLWSLTIKTTHYHVVLHQLQAGAAGRLMKTVLARYVRWFNAKYGEEGAMFIGETRLRPAADRRAELNAVAYVHENHGDHCYCEFCSHGAYMGHPADVPSWLDVGEALERFGGVGGYVSWLEARRMQRRVLGEPEPF